MSNSAVSAPYSTYLHGLAELNAHTQPAPMKITQLSMVYDKLCCILKEVNSYYGIHVSG